MPAYQYSAIWGNPHITGLIFLLTSFYFLKKLEFFKYKIKRYSYMGIIFLALACYTRQYYVIFFPYFFLIFFKNLILRELIKLIIFTTILGIPGLVFLLMNPLLLFSYHTLDISNFNSSIIISYSIMFFYLLPFFSLKSTPFGKGLDVILAYTLDLKSTRN